MAYLKGEVNTKHFSKIGMKYICIYKREREAERDRERERERASERERNERGNERDLACISLLACFNFS